ncbi:MAG TPA: GWxTD domain-containing protein [Longimicrobiales bacterium]
MVGQSTLARAELQRGVDAYVRGDTAAALELLDRAIALDPQLAEAHFQRGQILAHRSSARATDFEDRKEAQASLEAALRYDPGNPMYLLELGKLMLKQQIRLDAERIFKRALDAAARADAATLAEVHYQLGLMRETQWLRFSLRHNLPPHVAQLDADAAFDDARYVWDLLDASNALHDGGAVDRERMLHHFRAAIRANPAHAGANAHLLAYLYDEAPIEEYVAHARQFVRAAPSIPEAYLALGLGLYRAGNTDEAQGAFEYALSLMPPEDRADFENIARIMTKDLEERYASLSPDEQAEFRRRFWGQADPLFLTAANEFRLEYMARMTYADIRFGVPEYGLRGWETDRGMIYVRYGEPARKATFAPSTSSQGDLHAIGMLTTVWSYGRRGPVFVFRQNPGYRNANFANDFRFYAEDYRSVRPAVMASPSIPEPFELPIQVARFRGPGGALDIEVHSLVPLDRLGERAAVVNGEVELGLFVQDEGAREIKRETRAEVVEFRSDSTAPERIESWSLTLPQAQRYLVGVEAREPLTWRAAAGRAVVEPRSFPAGELAVSDLLLARDVEPLRAEPVARADFRIAPNPAMRYGPGDPVALYFEIYNLLPDADQFVSYEVELVVTIEEIEREGPALARIIGELADKWGLTQEGADAAQLRFRKEAYVQARDLVPEYFKVQFPDAPAGRYRLVLTVRDRNADRTAVTEREFRVGAPATEEAR